MIRFRLTVLALSVFVPSFVMAQPAPIGRLSAVVFDGGFPKEVYLAAKNADEVELRTADARKKAARRVSETREALQAALTDSTIKIEKFRSIDLGFLNALTDAIAVENELNIADAKVIQAHFAWRSTQGQLNLSVESAFADWMDGAVGSYFHPPADAVALMDQGGKRMNELFAADSEQRAKEREADDKKMKEFKELLDRVMKKPDGQ